MIHPDPPADTPLEAQLSTEALLDEASPDEASPAEASSAAVSSVNPARRPVLGSPRIKLDFLLLSLAVLVLDQWSKWMIEIHLPLHGGLNVISGFMNLTHVRNTGVAFGLFAAEGVESGSWLLTALGLAALLAVCVYFWTTPTKDRALLAALALVVGGAVGNLMDRATTGAVTDFLDLFVGTHHWPAFNVADAAISVGIVLMALDSLRPRPRDAEAAR